MRFLLRFIAFAALFTGWVCVAGAQNTTNKGTEFWTAYMDHVNGAGTSSGESTMSLYITSDVNTTGAVEIADGSFASIPYNVTANQVTIVNIPSNAFLANNTGISSKGIHITALKPVAIYAHIYAQSVSGATLLLPVSTLGKDYQSINYTQVSNSLTGDRKASYSVFEIIATDDNTSVQITPSVTLLSSELANNTFTITLKKGEVYQGLSNFDLTGTHIKSVSTNGVSCKRIAVFSGSSKISIGDCPNLNTSDNLYQQVYPTASWGKNYITVPLAGRNYDVFRVVVSDPATSITIDGAVIPNNQYASTGYYEFKSTTPKTVSADKPIQVVQYSVSQGNTLNCASGNGSDIGDPEMIYLNPLEQSLNEVTLYSTSNFKILSSFINVIIPAPGVASFTLDGTIYTKFVPVPGNAAYAYAQIPVAAGAHHISSTENFNATAYGFGDRESYGYAAGTNLKNLNEFISLQQGATKTPILSNGCSDLDYDLKITLPYQTNKITWDFKDGSAVVVQDNPIATTSVKNGQTLYTYSFTKTVKFKKGTYAIVATVFSPTVDECGDNENIEFDFNVVDPPAVKFGVVTGCYGENTKFTYVPDSTDPSVKTYLWDFGDGKTSTDQNPSHIYEAAGDFNVVLSVTNESGCASVSAPQKVHISKKPVAGFKASALNCAGSAITFTDQSVLEGETSASNWNWDFGDGVLSTEKNPVHTYALAGTYTVKLQIVNNNGCSSDVYTNDLVVHPLPVADFTMPDVCLSDAYAAFTNTSTIDDHTESEFTYLWNFGDGSPSDINNTSADINPKHKYHNTGDYNVSLTITSKYGCVSVTKTQKFTVNGSVPKASFSVENANNLCSGSDVIFDNLSTVDVGNITKIVWYFDTNNPADTTVFYKSKGQIPTDGRFIHYYGLFSTPITKTYGVKLRVYSGATCFDETPITNIVINANPTVDLVPIQTICQEAAPVQIVEDKHGFVGKGLFTGPGVTVTGLFDPAKAGVGVANLNYVFTASGTGCTYTTTMQIIVYPTPVVSAGNDVQMLDGMPTQLNGTATGNNLTYNWTPTIGLNRTDILNPLVNPTDNTTYTLTAVSADGCTATSQVTVYVLKLPEVPNTFTPNNDGINDLWYIKHLEDYRDCTVEIFTRNGEKIFTSVGYSIPWDGRYNGSELPVGVYYYIINPKNGRKVMSGSITIVR